jgi:ABC-type nitrate/sulfonate/bicarbonate transport system permease component
LLGCATGGVVGTLLGLAIARWSPLALFTEIPIGALRAVPPLAAIPFMVLWFGPLPEAQLGAVAFYTALMMVVTTTTAVGNLDPLAQRFARTLGARDGHVFRTVVLPSIIPELIGGLRVATGIAWGIEVVSELAGAPRGMGQVFSRMVSFQELSVIIVGIFWITVVATITDGFILAFARYATRWTPR